MPATLFGREPKALNQEEWIEKRGSKRLKAAKREGYDWEPIYVWERSKKEFPGFEPYPFARMPIAARPSARAIKALEKLKKNPRFDESVHQALVVGVRVERHNIIGLWSDDVAAEVVVLRGFLGEWDLCKLV